MQTRNEENQEEEGLKNRDWEMTKHTFSNNVKQQSIPSSMFYKWNFLRAALHVRDMYPHVLLLPRRQDLLPHLCLLLGSGWLQLFSPPRLIRNHLYYFHINEFVEPLSPAWWCQRTSPCHVGWEKECGLRVRGGLGCWLWCEECITPLLLSSKQRSYQGLCMVFFMLVSPDLVHVSCGRLEGKTHLCCDLERELTSRKVL